MGVCFSKSNGTSSRRGHEADLAMHSPTPSDRRAQGRSTGQAHAHLSGGLSDLSSRRPATSDAEVAAFHRQRVAELKSTRQQARLAAVTDVLKLVRETYYEPKLKLKSSNKTRPYRGAAEAKRQAAATEEIHRMRTEPDPLTAAMNGNAHNCQELSILAKHHLQQRGCPEAKILELGGDSKVVAHTVAIIGSAPDPLHADMSKWPADVYVCDPWSNIACSARDYPAEFTRKMEKWQKSGKAIGLDVASERFVAPTDPAWVGDVLRGKKMI